MKLRIVEPTVSEKSCSTCKEVKPADQFGRDYRLKSGLASRCKPCQSKASSRWAKNHKERRRQRRKEFRKEQPQLHLERSRERYKKNPQVFLNSQRRQKYGIEPHEYQELFQKQEGRCAICNIHASECKRALAVDHCHSSNNIRGLLCDNCNNGLGRFKDNIEFLTRAIDYLKRN